MRKYLSLLLGLVFAASIGVSACAKKEAPPPPPPPAPAAAPSDNAAAAPSNAGMTPEGAQQGTNQAAPAEQAPAK